MASKVTRQTVDLTQYPDLVVIYLGMRVNALAGIKTLFGFGPKISYSVAAKPDGLLLHENIIYSLFPLHAGMRQYWRDFQSLETCRGLSHTRSGGRILCATPAAPVFGMRRISCVAGSRRFMTTCRFPSVYRNLLPSLRRTVQCFPRARE